MPTHNMITSAYTTLSGHSQILSWQPCKVKSESGLGMKLITYATDYSFVLCSELSHSPHCHTPHTVTLPTLLHSPHCHTPHTVTLPTLLHSPHCYTVAIHEETELSRWVGGGADCQKVHETLHDNTSCIHPVLGSR